MAHAIFVPLVWMLRWEGEMILDIEDELLFNDFEGFFCHLTFDYACQESIDILLSCFEAYYFFIVFCNWKWYVKRTNVRVFIFSIVPTESPTFCFFFCEWEVIISN